MRIVIISDTHNKFISENDLPDGDILIHCGDSTNMGGAKEITDFVYWIMGIKKYSTKIFISGNHDFDFEYNKRYNIPVKTPWIKNLLYGENLTQSDCVYLENDEFTIEDPEFSKPIKFYGSPCTPQFGSWAFMLPRNSDKLREEWEKIPTDTDILITHGPPHWILDTVSRHGTTKLTGCELLFEKVREIMPLIHCFGHIHDQHGIIKHDETTFINASNCDDSYNMVYNPIVIDLKEINGKFEVIPVQI